MGLVKNILYKFAPAQMSASFKKQSIFPYYHLIKNHTVPHIEHLYRYKNVAQFNRDLDFLIKHYKPIDPKELLQGKRPENGFLLTFDDGLLEVYTEIYPILKKRQIPAIFFVNPKYVGNHDTLYKHDISLILSELTHAGQEVKSKIASLLEVADPNEITQKIRFIAYSDRSKLADIAQLLKLNIRSYVEKQPIYMTEIHIRQMLDDGFYFGGHSYSHPPLDQIPFEDQKREIISSIEWVKEKFGVAYSMFAFPFSDKSASKALIKELLDYDQNILIFGNSGIKQDIDPRIIQRFSFENPDKETAKLVVSENLYKIFNKIIGKYKVRR